MVTKSLRTGYEARTMVGILVPSRYQDTCRLISLVGVKWSCLRINQKAFPPLEEPLATEPPPPPHLGLRGHAPPAANHSLCLLTALLTRCAALGSALPTEAKVESGDVSKRRAHLRRVDRLLPERQCWNLALTVLCVPGLLDSGAWSTIHGYLVHKKPPPPPQTTIGL